ncbi:16S rRNA (guanine(966)-N(2))-methyltransferase RsmD [Aestuariivita boseongensis]|uniref:16S rRNA (guanine(966)-N(2))-methyltransferase RsmD n=1 Tax=Aestuariivita boseongensis TaxID=1470562 RepID=UPI0006801909|nr:16S rRNA (guanine(966)-N(2))-methyltransferase RsmD [Aestuariivita boseongensis]
MRIIAGAFRGRRLAAVGKGDAAGHLRPTSDRVRESLFSMLTHMDVLEGAEVLDLFAGTGALGLEALSRGAEFVTFVEKGRVGQGLIRENIRITGSAQKTRLIARDATRLGQADRQATLVFLDPPYGKALGERAVEAVVAGGWLAEGALLVWEEAAPVNPPPGFALEDSRAFGGTHITFLRFVGQAAS